MLYLVIVEVYNYFDLKLYKYNIYFKKSSSRKSYSGYSPCPYVFYSMSIFSLASMIDTRKYAFYDLGSGCGIVLFFARGQGFKSVKGYEVDREVFLVSLKNFPMLNVENIDCRNITYLNQHSVFFIYEICAVAIFDEILDRLVHVKDHYLIIIHNEYRLSYLNSLANKNYITMDSYAFTEKKGYSIFKSSHTT